MRSNDKEAKQSKISLTQPIKEFELKQKDTGIDLMAETFSFVAAENIIGFMSRLTNRIVYIDLTAGEVRGKVDLGSDNDIAVIAPDEGGLFTVVRSEAGHAIGKNQQVICRWEGASSVPTYQISVPYKNDPRLQWFQDNAPSFEGSNPTFTQMSIFPQNKDFLMVFNRVGLRCCIGNVAQNKWGPNLELTDMSYTHGPTDSSFATIFPNGRLAICLSYEGLLSQRSTIGLFEADLQALEGKQIAQYETDKFLDTIKMSPIDTSRLVATALRFKDKQVVGVNLCFYRLAGPKLILERELTLDAKSSRSLRLLSDGTAFIRAKNGFYLCTPDSIMRFDSPSLFEVCCLASDKFVAMAATDDVLSFKFKEFSYLKQPLNSLLMSAIPHAPKEVVNLIVDYAVSYDNKLYLENTLAAPARLDEETQIKLESLFQNLNISFQRAKNQMKPAQFDNIDAVAYTALRYFSESLKDPKKSIEICIDETLRLFPKAAKKKDVIEFFTFLKQQLKKEEKHSPNAGP